MPWSSTVGPNGIYTWKWRAGALGWGIREWAGKAQAPRRRAGGRLYLHRSGPNGLFLALGRRGRRYLQEESSMA